MFEFITKWLQRENPQVIQERAISYETGLSGGLVLEPTGSGIHLNPERQLAVSSFYAAVRHISEALASLPVRVMAKQADGGKLVDESNPTHFLIANEPNSYQTSAVWREWLMVQVLLYGNAYSKIERSGDGRVIALHPIPAMYVQVSWNVPTKSLTYHVETSVYTEQETLSAQEMLHITAMSLDGIVGLSPIEYNRESMALSLALDKFASCWFGNGARPSGVLKTTGMLSDKAKMNLKESWKRAYTGTSKSGECPVLEEGLDFIPFQYRNDEAQFLETKQNQVRESSRWAKISPTKLGDLSRATWSNIESENLSFITTTLAPWIHKLEQEFNRKLLLPSERPTYTVEFDISGLLRGDSKTRYANHASALQAGWKTVNEIRLEESLPPVEGGDELRQPLTHGAVDEQGDTESNQDDKQEAEEFNTEKDKDAD